jgi:hypothetical protein
MFWNRKGTWVVPVLLLGCALGVPGGAVAQEPSRETGAQAEQSSAAKMRRAPEPGDETRVFVLQHARPRILAEILRAFPATIEYSAWGSEPPGLAVSAPPAVMAAIAEAVQRLDQPMTDKSIELTAYILEAMVDSQETQVPRVLEDVVARLRETFRYQGYRVIDSLVARTGEGTKIVLQGVSPAPSPLTSLSYTLKVTQARVLDRDSASPRVRLDRLDLQVSAEHERRGTLDSAVYASIEIGEGQQVVVGKAGLGGSGNAFILVLSAEVID